MISQRVIAILAASRPQEEALRAVVEQLQEVRLGTCLPMWQGSNPPSLPEPAPEVVLLDLPGALSNVLERVRDLQSLWPQAVWFAVGEVDQPQAIIEVMRAGIREYLERPLTAAALREALGRLPVREEKRAVAAVERQQICVLGAHGGVGATTIAVNLAALLQRNHGSCLLVDFAPLGHAALHLNLQPSYGLSDALAHLRRLDAAVVNSLVMRHESGLHLLAGTYRPVAIPPAEMVELVTTLQQHFRIVVMDLSARWDAAVAAVVGSAQQTLLVTQADVVGLWSAARVAEQLGLMEGTLQLVLNRYQRQPGFDLKQVEHAVRAPVAGTLPSAYATVAEAIADGEPLALRKGSELARAYAVLAQTLMPQDVAEERPRWSLFRR